MRASAVLVLLLAGPLLGGCFGNAGLGCEKPQRYATSGSAPPVRVPDDLNVPNESDALQIPPGQPLEVPSDDKSAPCLERPPSYLDDDSDDDNDEAAQ